MKKFIKTYQEIVTIDKLLLAWKRFLIGKKKHNDVIIFQARLMDNILALYLDLINKTYIHKGYKSFYISDPKPRHIHKAVVRDRLLHHLIYQETYQYFDSKFIYDSYSCRLDKGTHKAIYRLGDLEKIVSKNNKKAIWVLKCDIRHFFASIDHKILKSILKKYITNTDLLWLFEEIIDSFYTFGNKGVGLPLGNLTSQLLVNIYMNEFDQFVKRELKAKYYLRYADDFIFLSPDEKYLIELKSKIGLFLNEKLKLKLHPTKVFIKTFSSGVDFLGWIHFNNFRVLKTATKKRMLKKIKNNPKKATVVSYLALLKHGSTYKLKKRTKLDDYRL